MTQFAVLADSGYRFDYVTTVEAETVPQARKLALAYFGGDYRSRRPFKVSRVAQVSA